MPVRQKSAKASPSLGFGFADAAPEAAATSRKVGQKTTRSPSERPGKVQKVEQKSTKRVVPVVPDKKGKKTPPAPVISAARVGKSPAKKVEKPKAKVAPAAEKPKARPDTPVEAARSKGHEEIVRFIQRMLQRTLPKLQRDRHLAVHVADYDGPPGGAEDPRV